MSANLLTPDGQNIQDQWKTSLDNAKGSFLDDNELQLKSGTSGNEVYSCASPAFFSYQFTSTADGVNFTPGVTPPPTGVLNDSNDGVFMGLDPAQFSSGGTGQQTVSAVMHAFGIDAITSNLSSTLQKIVNILEQAGEMNVVLNRQDQIPIRNGFWIFPTDANTLEIAVKLSFEISGANIQHLIDQNQFTTDIKNALKSEFGITVPDSLGTFTFPTNVTDDFLIVLATKTTFTPNAQGQKYSILVKLPNIAGFNLYVGQDNFASDKATTVALTQYRTSTSSQQDAISNVSNLSSGFAPSTSDAVPKGDSDFIFDDLHLWYVELVMSTPSNAWSIAIAINLPFAGTSKLPIYLEYVTGTNTFNGGVLVTSAIKDVLPPGSQEFLPDFKEYRGLPSTFTPVQDFIDLGQLFGADLPASLPFQLTKGQVKYSQANNAKSIDVLVTLQGPQGSDPQNIPAKFAWTNATFHYNKTPDEKGVVKTTTEVLAEVDLAKAKIILSLQYATPQWHLTGTASNLNFGQLADFVDPGVSASVLSVLGRLTISNLLVEYIYEKKDTTGPHPAASSFLFTGTVTIATTLELDMYYQYTTDETEANNMLNAHPNPHNVTAPHVGAQGSSWAFDCFLSAMQDGVTIAEILNDIAGIRDIPGFIGDIPLQSDPSKKSAVSIRARRETVTGVGDTVVFYFDLSIGFLDFTFVQVARPDSSAPTTPTRILRFSVGPLPLFNTLPVIKELPQPYQSLNYVYAGGPDDVTSIETTTMDWLNDNYFTFEGGAKLYYKSDAGNQPALRMGNHFIVVNNDTCILDHVFGATDSPSTTLPTETSEKKTSNLPLHSVKAVVPTVARQDATDSGSENPPTKGTLKKVTQFISISGIAVQYKQQTLWLFMDATITLGPIEMDLIGFGIGLDLSNVKSFNLSSLLKNPQAVIDDLRFQLHGMAMDFNQPPVLIAGVFEHEVTDKIDAYRGGIAVGFAPYDFAAVGEYAEVHDNGDDYKSIFIYAKLDGPLIDLEIAIVEGIRLGFGYNSFIRSPTVQELPDFPLINDVGVGGAGNNPMAILTAMRGGDNPWVQVKHDAFWFAFGFSISAFDIITATAVALLEFTDRGVDVNIFADVIAQMPPDVKQRDECIVYVELLLNADLNFIDDYFFVQAALAPTSFLLVPECHLFGGFAAGSWFGTSDHAGDWVFTVGGYHRQFTPPTYYPKPDRLGIQFSIGDNMTIRGEGYFAITPKAVMGGAAIYIQLSVGPVGAHLNAAFDALVQFHPLHYIIDLSVDVGVYCHVHFLFVSFDVNIDIGADLHIEGPQFGGMAHVDFWFFGFDVYFGASPSPPDPLHLLDFYNVLAKAGPPEDNSPPTDTTSRDYETMLKMAIENGAFPATPTNTTGQPPEGGVGGGWRVRGGNFQFRISSVFAISNASFWTQDTDDPTTDEQVTVDQSVGFITSVPMQITATVPPAPPAITSPLRIKILNEDASGPDTIPTGWQPSFVVKTVPKAMWADPATYSDNQKLDNTVSPTTPMQMAISIKSPPPLLSASKIPPVNATDINNAFVPNTAPIQPTESQTQFFPATGSDVSTQAKAVTAWNALQKTWEDSDKGNNAVVAQDLADSCMSALGWDNPPTEYVTKAANQTPKPWQLSAKFPSRLVSGTGDPDKADGLVNTYLALPRLVVV